MPEEIHIKCMYILDIVHLCGTKKVSDVIKNAQNSKFQKARCCSFTYA